MKNPVLNLAALALGGLAMLAAPALQAREKLTPDQQLAKMLQDREAGKPVNCINLSQVRGTTIVDKTAIVYDMGNVLYVNRPSHPQPLDDDDVMVTNTWSGQLCRLDMVHLHTRAGLGFWWRGTVGLEDFVPYTKPKPAPAPEAAKG